MDSLNFVVLGDQGIAENFGKKGTQTDITLYDRKESGIIRTWVAPNGFPEKIQPLFQAINLSEFAIMHIPTLDRYAGEQIVALDVLEKGRGILSHSYQVDEDALDGMIRGTVLEKYARAEPDRINEAISKIKPTSSSGRTRILIDHCFDVKGVGTVVLGKVAYGTIAKYDELVLLPSGAKVMVKSIQMHDDPVNTAESPARVGLSLKGVRPDQVERGDVLCEADVMQVSDMLELDFARTPYYKDRIAEGHMCLVSVGLKIMAGKFASISPFRIKLDRPIAYNASDIATVLKPESASIRILGSGRIS